MRFSPFLKLNNGFHYLRPKIPGAELNSKTLKLRKFFDWRPLSKVTGVLNIFFILFLFLGLVTHCHRVVKMKDKNLIIIFSCSQEVSEK